MSLLKLNPANIVQAKGHIRRFGHVYLHGCGNMYKKEEDSLFRRQFTNVNPDQTPSPSTYWIYFNDVNQVPNSLEKLEKMILEAKNREQSDAAKKKSFTTVDTFGVHPDDVASLEDDFTEGAYFHDEELQNQKALQLKRGQAVEGSDHDKEKEQTKDDLIAALQAKLAELTGEPKADGDGGKDTGEVDNRTPAQKRKDTLEAKAKAIEGKVGEPKADGDGVTI